MNRSQEDYIKKMEHLETRLAHLKDSIKTLLDSMDSEAERLDYATYMDHFCQIAIELQAVTKAFSKLNLPNWNCLSVVPVKVSSENDKELASLTEGRVQAFAGDTASTYLGTRPDAKTLQDMHASAQKLSNTSEEAAAKEVAEFYASVKSVLDIVAKFKAMPATESRSDMEPETSNMCGNDNEGAASVGNPFQGIASGIDPRARYNEGDTASKRIFDPPIAPGSNLSQGTVSRNDPRLRYNRGIYGPAIAIGSNLFQGTASRSDPRGRYNEGDTASKSIFDPPIAPASNLFQGVARRNDPRLRYNRGIYGPAIAIGSNTDEGIASGSNARERDAKEDVSGSDIANPTAGETPRQKIKINIVPATTFESSKKKK